MTKLGEQKQVEENISLISTELFKKFPALDTQEISCIVNRTLLDNMIKNPKDDDGKFIIDISKEELISLRALKKRFKS